MLEAKRPELPELPALTPNLVPANPGITPNTVPVPANPQGGIIAKIIRKYECKYGSGGRPSTRSHHFCKVEFSLESTSDKSIAFSTGFTETEHAWNGEMNRTRVGYTHDLHPGKIMRLGGVCIIPHDASTGNWRAWGTGHHRGNSNKEQFSWSIGVGCSK